MAAVDVIPVEVAAAPPNRPRVLLIGTALVVGGVRDGVRRPDRRLPLEPVERRSPRARPGCPMARRSR